MILSWLTSQLGYLGSSINNVTQSWTDNVQNWTDNVRSIMGSEPVTNYPISTIQFSSMNSSTLDYTSYSEGVNLSHTSSGFITDMATISQISSGITTSFPDVATISHTSNGLTTSFPDMATISTSNGVTTNFPDVATISYTGISTSSAGNYTTNDVASTNYPVVIGVANTSYPVVFTSTENYSFPTIPPSIENSNLSRYFVHLSNPTRNTSVENGDNTTISNLAETKSFQYWYHIGFIPSPLQSSITIAVFSILFGIYLCFLAVAFKKITIVVWPCAFSLFYTFVIMLFIESRTYEWPHRLIIYLVVLCSLLILYAVLFYTIQWTGRVVLGSSIGFTIAFQLFNCIPQLYEWSTWIKCICILIMMMLIVITLFTKVNTYILLGFSSIHGSLLVFIGLDLLLHMGILDTLQSISNASSIDSNWKYMIGVFVLSFVSLLGQSVLMWRARTLKTDQDIRYL